MRLIINLVLLALVALLVFVLISSIRAPIAFQAEKQKRVDAVVDRLKDLRKAQEIYRDVTGEFTNDYSELKNVLQTGKIMTVAVIGDPDDPNNSEISYDTTYVPAMQSINEYGISLDSLQMVPYGNPGTEFELFADTMTYQKTLVHVIEAKTTFNQFMGAEFSKEKYKKYDDRYNPKAPLKFGDRYTPNLTGNWE
mgnify:CR=1 FL=1